MRKFLVRAMIASLLLASVSSVSFGQARMDLNVGQVLEPPSLDPTAEAAGAVDEIVYANVFEGLVRFAPDGSVVPALAKTWDISDDGLSYTFHLNAGVTFHDGTEFNADDVKFSLDRINAPGSLNAQKQLYSDIASVVPVDPNTVRIELSKPNGNLVYNLAWGDAVMVAPESAANNKVHPIGTGPFLFADRIEGDHITLRRNPKYWGAPVQLDAVTFRIVGDPSAAFAALQAGDIDVFPDYPAPETLSQFESDPRFAVVVGATQGETVLSMNNGRAPLDNVKVRAAIAHAIDRKAIIDGAMFGYGLPIGTFFPPSDPNYVDLTATSQYDPVLSRSLLAEAGWDGSKALSLKLPPVEVFRRAGAIIAQELAAVGIKTETTNIEWAQWLGEVFTEKNYDLTIIAHSEPNDIGIFGRDGYYFDYKGQAFRTTMAQLDVTADPAKRGELLKTAQRILADDYAAGFLFEYPKLMVRNVKLGGMWENAPAQANDLTAVHWEP